MKGDRMSSRELPCKTSLPLVHVVVLVAAAAAMNSLTRWWAAYRVSCIKERCCAIGPSPALAALHHVQPQCACQSDVCAQVSHELSVPAVTAMLLSALAFATAAWSGLALAAALSPRARASLQSLAALAALGATVAVRTLCINP